MFLPAESFVLYWLWLSSALANLSLPWAFLTWSLIGNVANKKLFECRLLIADMNVKKIPRNNNCFAAAVVHAAACCSQTRKVYRRLGVFVAIRFKGINLHCHWFHINYNNLRGWFVDGDSWLLMVYELIKSEALTQHLKLFFDVPFVSRNLRTTSKKYPINEVHPQAAGTNSFNTKVSLFNLSLARLRQRIKKQAVVSKVFN